MFIPCRFSRFTSAIMGLNLKKIVITSISKPFSTYIVANDNGRIYFRYQTAFQHYSTNTVDGALRISFCLVGGDT